MERELEEGGQGGERGNGREFEVYSQLVRVLRGAVRGAAVGATLHAGLNLLSGLASGKLLQNPALYVRGVVTIDAARFAGVCGTMTATYRALSCLLRAFAPDLEEYHPFMAGLVAGLISIFDNPERRLTLTTAMAARALGVVIINFNQRGLLPTVPRFVTLILTLSQSVITMAMVLYPNYLPPAYYRALLKWSQYYTHDILETYFRSPLPSPASCSLLHRGSCHSAAYWDLLRGLWLFFKIYITLYSLPLLAFRRQQLFQQPLKSLSGLLQNSLRSAVFFAVESSLIKYMFCLIRNAWPHTPPVPAIIPFLSGMIGSLALLIERPSRLVELNYYILPQILYATVQLLKRGPLPVGKTPCGSVPFFSLSLAILIHASHVNDISLSPVLARLVRFIYRD